MLCIKYIYKFEYVCTLYKNTKHWQCSSFNSVHLFVFFWKQMYIEPRTFEAHHCVVSFGKETTVTCDFRKDVEKKCIFVNRLGIEKLKQNVVQFNDVKKNLLHFGELKSRKWAMGLKYVTLLHGRQQLNEFPFSNLSHVCYANKKGWSTCRFYKSKKECNLCQHIGQNTFIFHEKANSICPHYYIIRNYFVQREREMLIYELKSSCTLVHSHSRSQCAFAWSKHSWKCHPMYIF